jgi:hypothetical protein
MQRAHHWVTVLKTGHRPPATTLPPPAPQLTTAHAIPGGLLQGLEHEGVHYLDLGGVQAASLLDFGGTDALWGGVTKLYASRCGLTSLDGIARLTSVRYLYLDHNQLGAEELRRLCAALPAGQLEALDLSGNCGGEDPELVEALLCSGLLARCQFLNGRRLRDG